jgi:Glycosyl transferase family 2
MSTGFVGNRRSKQSHLQARTRIYIPKRGLLGSRRCHMCKDSSPATTPSEPKVAVLLATYNGARHVERQIRSLRDNTIAFALHWLDDQSTDETRSIVRTICLELGIPLREWHQSERQGIPGAFFTLLEHAEADIYLFCDQDDIWQPGKIDVTVMNLVPDLATPALCFSEPFVFKDNDTSTVLPLSDVTGMNAAAALDASRLFMSAAAFGHTEGFTRALRDIFFAHKDIARTHAYMHDLWMYNIAMVSGVARKLTDVPTTLYRLHSSNVSNGFSGWSGKGIGRLRVTWTQHQQLRRTLARHAKGFALASPTLKPGPKLERSLAIARLVASLDQRQSPMALIRLAYGGVLWPSLRLALGLSAACLCTNA